MSFLRSVIADARPPKPMLEPSNVASAINGWKSRGLDGDASGAEEKSPVAQEQTSRLSTSLPIQEGASDFNTSDVPDCQADNPVNPDIQDMGSNIEPENPLSVTVDKSGPIPDEESHARMDTGNVPDWNSGSEGVKASNTEESMIPQAAGTVIPDNRMNSPKGQDHDPSFTSAETRDAQYRASGHDETEPASSPAIIWDTPGRESSKRDGNSTPLAEDGAGQFGMHETMSSAAEGNTHSQAEVTGITVAGDRLDSPGSIKVPETLTIQADAIQTTAEMSPKSSRRIELSAREASLVPSDLSPDASGDPMLGTVALAVSHGAGTDGDLQHSGESGMDNVSDPVSEQAPTPDNSTGRNEAEKTLADAGKARQVSPGVNKQADMKSQSNQEDIARLQKLGEQKGVHRDVQLISRQAMVMASQGSSDMEHASVPPSVTQPAGKKVRASASSPDPAPSNPGNAEQHVTSSARPSASPEALRTVPATPFQTDWIPKTGDSFRSRPPLRSPEKTHDAPKVQIGQIDVIIEAPAQTTAKSAPASSPIDLASRYYLRGL